MTFKRVEEVTPKQLELYDFLVRHVEQFGYQPSLKEMGEAFGVTRNAVKDRVKQLVHKGLVALPAVYQDRCLGLPGLRFAAAHLPAPGGLGARLGEAHWAAYEVLVRYVEDHGFQPSLVEIGEAVGVTRTAAGYTVRVLADAGYVTLPDKYQERCLGLPFVAFTAAPG